jgi:hypothetical protein
MRGLIVPIKCHSQDISQLNEKETGLGLKVKSKFSHEFPLSLTKKPSEPLSAEIIDKAKRISIRRSLYRTFSQNSLPGSSASEQTSILSRNVPLEPNSESGACLILPSDHTSFSSRKNPFAKDFYQRIGDYLDSLGLEAVDTEDYYQELDTLKKLQVSKHLSMNEEPESNSDSCLAIKMTRSESYAPVINQRLSGSSLLMRRVSSKGSDSNNSLFNSPIKKPVLLMPIDFDCNEFCGSNEEEELNAGSRLWNQETMNLISEDTSPSSSPLKLRINKGKKLVLALQPNLDEESPKAPIRLKKKNKDV